MAGRAAAGRFAGAEDTAADGDAAAVPDAGDFFAVDPVVLAGVARFGDDDFAPASVDAVDALAPVFRGVRGVVAEDVDRGEADRGERGFGEPDGVASPSSAGVRPDA